jgi:hypothetical protein
MVGMNAPSARDIPFETLAGIPVFLNSNIPFGTQKGRPLPHKKWHEKGGYARRIRKKWQKKYTHEAPGFYIIGNPMIGIDSKYIMHPDKFKQLKEHFQQRKG